MYIYKYPTIYIYYTRLLLNYHYFIRFDCYDVLMLYKCVYIGRVVWCIYATRCIMEVHSYKFYYTYLCIMSIILCMCTVLYMYTVDRVKHIEIDEFNQ